MQTEARGKILLRVSGILLIIYAALLIVLGLIVMVGGSYILGAGDVYKRQTIFPDCFCCV